MSTYREQGEQAKKKNEEDTLAQADTEKAEVNTQIDQLIAKAESDAAAQQQTVESDYRDLIDTVAVQRELDRRQISEAMANMGLTKSGLNATQQTAVQLSAGNKTAAAQRQRQAAVDALTQSLAEYKMEAENNRRESVNAIDSAAQQSIAEYNAAVDKNVADAENAEIEANAKLIKAQNEAQSTNASTLLTMAKNGAIGWDTYAYAVDAGLSPSQAVAVQNTASDNSDNTEASQWSWSTTAYRKYGKDTVNDIFGIGTWLGNIDRDDRVEFINSEGEIQDISLEDLYDNLVNEGMSKENAKAFVVRFNKLDDNNGTYFIDAAGKRSFFDGTAFYVAQANKDYGKDGVLAELESAYEQCVINDLEYERIAQTFKITEEDIKTFRKQGFLTLDFATVLKLCTNAIERYDGWE